MNLFLRLLLLHELNLQVKTIYLTLPWTRGPEGYWLAVELENEFWVGFTLNAHVNLQRRCDSMVVEHGGFVTGDEIGSAGAGAGANEAVGLGFLKAKKPYS